jgi:hypothetical protein
MGCGQAVPPADYPAPEPLWVDAPQAELWRAAIDLATEMQLPISTIDAGSGYLRTDRAPLPEPARGDWWDCRQRLRSSGEGDMPDWERQMLGRTPSAEDTSRVLPGLAPSGGIAVALVERSGRTQLRVIVTELALGSGGGEACRSKGAFEPHFLSAVVDRWRSLYRSPKQD